MKLAYQDQDEQGGASVAQGGGNPEVLSKVLQAGPFGLRVEGPNGADVFDNGKGVSLPGADPEFCCTRKFEISVAGEPYAIELTVDESERFAREQELIERAYLDDLTRLANRALFEKTVSDQIATDPSVPFAIAIFDLDGFKFINDYYGHDAGDLLLTGISKRLQSCLRPSDLLARLSGDEFALLLQPVDDPESLKQDFEWLAERIKEPIVIDGSEIVTSASVGVSLYPKDGHDYQTLRGNADRAMYRSKHREKGSVQFYDQGIEHAFADRSRAEQRVRLAIRDCRVSCAYQPKVDIRSGEVSGVEVLMRWRDEEGSIQPPGDFVQLAVDLGLMDDLTLYILAETVDSIDLINDAFGRDATISINIAARQAGDPRFMKSFLGALSDSSRPERFILELTEEAFIEKANFEQLILPMIRETGAGISIDDFGTGYSSLSALAHITADEVKIDRSFITEVHRRPRSQAVLKAIEALGRSLGMSVVVEGVETREELLYLKAQTQITHAQGYYFSKPLFLHEEAKSAGEASKPRMSELSRYAGLSRHR